MVEVLIFSTVKQTGTDKMRFSKIFLAGVAATGATAAKFTFTGVNESGGEFGEANLPGALGKDYIWPSTSAIDVCSLTMCPSQD
jgi:endoglucanase